MAKVFVHLHSQNEADWINKYHKFERIPVENEYLSVSEDSTWYRVEMVVHTPFSKEISAEVYAVKVDHNKELAKKVKYLKNSFETLK